MQPQSIATLPVINLEFFTYCLARFRNRSKTFLPSFLKHANVISSVSPKIQVCYPQTLRDTEFIFGIQLLWVMCLIPNKCFWPWLLSLKFDTDSVVATLSSAENVCHCLPSCKKFLSHFKSAIALTPGRTGDFSRI